MVFELHIWGPAFGLPSIDPQCLATVAYFSLAVPAKEWALIPDSDPSRVPTNELPALWTESRWISGFRNIVGYLSQYSDGEWDLDRWMGKEERADCTAFSSFLESQGQPLIGLSLYVSSENYNAATAPSYASLLHWPNQWILPPQIRSLAKRRTEHLGLSSLDLESTEEEEKQRARDPTNPDAQIPQSLKKKPPVTVSGLLGKTGQNSRIRLEGMTGAFIAPMEELLLRRKGHFYLLSDEIPSSLDCLALGYLSLALVPGLPSPWLREAVTGQSARLVAYVDRLRIKCYGAGHVDVNTVFSELDSPNNRASSVLPWRAPERMSVGAMGARVLEGIADSTPIVREIRASRRLQRVGAQSEEAEEGKLIEEIAKARRREVYSSVASVLAGVGLFVAYLIHSGGIRIVSTEEDVYKDGEDEGETGSTFGEAGAVLGI